MDRSFFAAAAAALLSLAITPTFVYAQEEGFDSIVKELKSSLKDPVPTPKYDSESPRVIAGAGIVGSYVNANAGSALLSGFDLHLGVELFTSQWLAEMSLRSFSTARLQGGSTMSLDEYDIKLIHENELQRTLNLRVGGGLAAQYLKTSANGNSNTESAPSLIALVGLEKVFSPKLTVGPDLSLFMPLISNSDEKASLDASLRLNFYF
jgi:hypothetical protein